MAVSATDIAFIDFCYYADEGQSVANHLTYASYFVTSMVKLQYDWICFPAVYTRMRQQILQHIGLCYLCAKSLGSIHVSHVDVLARLVVFRLTRPAVGMQPVLAAA